MHRKLLTAVLVVGTALTLTACVPDDPAPTPVPSPSRATPLFATDEEALAAAEKVYREYLAVVARGDVDSLRLLTSSSWFAEEQSGLDELSRRGLHFTGESQLRELTLQSRNFDQMTTYACLDMSGSRLLDQAGNDVTPSTRSDLSLFAVDFVSSGETLVIDKVELWSTSC